jgi:hypothetical protein
MLRKLSSILAVAAGLTAASPLLAHETVHRSAPQAFGAGTAETWVTVGHQGRPLEVGLAISEAGFDAIDEYHSIALSLPLPPQAEITGFKHVLLNWNHAGHAPTGVFDVAHVDVHFYLTDAAAREAIEPTDPDFWEKAAREPARELMPADFVPPPTLEPIPAMGVHWTDKTDPVFQGAPFSHVLIYGAWDGAVTFIEPMLVNEVFASKETVTAEIKQPARVAEPGFYPRTYRIDFDPERRMHLVVLEDLVWREPE